MGNVIVVIIVLVLLAIVVGQPLLVLFSRRYPRKQENPGRPEPPAW